MYCPYFDCVNARECTEIECDTLECKFYGCHYCEMVCNSTCPGIEMKKRERRNK